jgi:hypothetical protein
VLSPAANPRVLLANPRVRLAEIVDEIGSDAVLNLLAAAEAA